MEIAAFIILLLFIFGVKIVFDHPNIIIWALIALGALLLL